MSAKRLFRILCVGLIATMSFSVSPVMSQLTEEQQALVNASLDEFAFLLKDALAKPENQVYVWNQISTSRNEEQIVDLETLVSEASTEITASGIWEELGGALSALEDALSDQNGIAMAQDANAPALPTFDLYFPVEEHREKWDGTAKNLLVAYAPVGNEENVDSIVAYNVETGEMVVLDPNNPPEMPTLVVGVDEHESLEAEPPLAEVAAPVDADADPCAVDVGDTNSYIGVPWIYLVDDQEPWWKGRAEIYVLVGQVVNGRAITHKIYLKKVDYEGRWYYLGNRKLYFYCNNSYAAQTYFHFWEEDAGGSPFSVNASIFGVGFGFTAYDNDDDMGKRYVDRNAVPWVGTKRFSTGYVRFEVDKDP